MAKWDVLSNRLRREVSKRDRVKFVTTATLPANLRKSYGEVNGFQTDDGTIYILTDVIAKYGGNPEHTLQHEMAHRILRHRQVGEKTRAKTALGESIRHERDVNLLLNKTYGWPSAEDYKDELRAHVMPWTYEEGGTASYGEIFATVKRNVLESPDVPDSWKTAVKRWRRESAKKLADVYGHDIDYAEWVLSQDKRPDVLNNLVKHAWYGMSSYEPDWEEDVSSPRKYTAYGGAIKRKRIQREQKRRSSQRGESVPTSVRGLR